MKKRIEMLTDVKDAPGYFKGEVRIVSVETAGYFCGLGWAKDIDGQIPTAETDTEDKTLAVDAGKHGHAAATP